ncbi:MAG: hypothetical protein ACK53Y_03630, partial [bacterium]
PHSGDDIHLLSPRLHHCNCRGGRGAWVVMPGPQLVRPGRQRLGVLMVHVRQQHADLPRQTLQKNTGEEVTLLLAPGAGLQYGRHEIRRLPAAQGWHLEQLLRLLEVRQLMRGDETVLDVVVGCGGRRLLHQVRHHPQRLVRKRCHHVTVSIKLSRHVFDCKRALRLGEPQRRRLRPERRELDGALGRRWRRWRRVRLLNAHPRCRTCSNVSGHQCSDED